MLMLMLMCVYACKPNIQLILHRLLPLLLQLLLLLLPGNSKSRSLYYYYCHYTLPLDSHVFLYRFRHGIHDCTPYSPTFVLYITLSALFIHCGARDKVLCKPQRRTRQWLETLQCQTPVVFGQAGNICEAALARRTP
jgi:hypothetical protein